jgi:tetratricopeptide (TPR) repeat protein
LSVFAGGWTLEAAVAVTNDDEEFAVLAGLERLVEHNLVRASEQTDRDVRFSMLETIREYSLDRLEERGEAEEARQRHAQHFLDLVDRAEPELRGPEQQRWLDRLEAEHDNLRAALQWPGSEALPDSCLRLAAGLWQFWMARGYVSEGRGWLSRALATGTTAPSAARAKALDGAGVMAIGQGDYVEAKALLEESLASFRAIGNKQGMARAMHHLGIQRLHQGDHGRASALFDEALALFRELADLRGVSSIRHLQGELFAEQGDLEQAQRFAEESLALWRTLGDKSSMSTSLDNLAILAFIRGDYDRATMLAEEGRDLASELGNKRVFATSLLHLGDIALEQGDLEQARRQYVEGLMVSREIGDRAVMISCLDGVACLAIAEGKPDDATRLFSSVDALSDAIGISRPAHNQHRYERHLAVLCTQLSADDFTAARNAGRLLSLEEVVAGVLADAGG